MRSLHRALALAVPLALAVAGGLGPAAQAAPALSPKLFQDRGEATSAPQRERPALIAAASTVPTPQPAGASVRSPDGRTRMAMQNDGNLVVYKDGRAVYNTRTFVVGSTLDTDEYGNLQVVAPDGTWLWSTNLMDAAQVVVDDAGALKVLDAGGAVRWDSRDPVEDTFNLEEAESLEPGQSIRTIQGGRLVMQFDGNLVSYNRGNSVIFHTSTFVPGSRLRVQSDGNTVIYGPDGRWLWQTATAGRAATTFLYDGELFVVDENIELLFHSGQSTAARNPTPVRSLTARQSVTSLNGRFRLEMRADGNLALSETSTGRVEWNSRTAGSPGARFAVQPDGNLVIYRADNRVAWTTRTQGRNTRLVLQDDGNLVLRSSTGAVMWRARR